MATYKKLIVWQKSYKLSLEIYKITREFPKDELYGLTSQLRRASVSIPSNIAEGNVRNSRKEYIQFLHIALGSSVEVQTQLSISHDLNYLKTKDYDEIISLLEEIIKMLNAIIKKLTL